MEFYHILCIFTILSKFSVGGAVLDITTVYRHYEFQNYSNTRAECHSRTNALGLSFVAPNESTIDPHVGVDLPSCYRHDCSWTIRDWNLVGDVGRFGLPPLDVPPEVHQLTTNDSMSELIPLSHGRFNLRIRTSSKGIGRVLLLAESNVSTSDLYVIDIVHNDLYKIHMSSLLFKCGAGRHYLQGVVVVPGIQQRRCYAIGNQHVRWLNEQEVEFAVDIEGDAIKIIQEGHKTPLLSERDQAKLNVKYIAFVSVRMKRQWTLQLESRAWLLARSGGWLRSPTVKTTAHMTCVSFFSYLEPGKNATIKVTGKMLNGTRKLFGLITRNEEHTWIPHRLDIDMGVSKSKGDGADQVVQVLIQGQADHEVAKIAIHGLKGCNPFDYEDIALVEVPAEKQGFVCSAGKSVATSRRFKDNAGVTYNKECVSGVCLHGGVCDKTVGQCACPPGFVGQTCAEGCGANSFGQDCLGSCSGRLSGCSAMTLCTTLTGCNCAPGFTGTICDKACKGGRYGVNCSETCGHCSNGSACDKFTGLCVRGCVTGFTMPLCKEPTCYMRNPPNVTAIEYSKARTEFWLRSEDLKGSGQPYFYQIQYRGTNDTQWKYDSPKLVPQAARVSPVISVVYNLVPGRTYLLRVVLYTEDSNYYDNETVVPVSKFTTKCEIPTQPIYDVVALWKNKTGLEIRWEYEGNNPAACELDHFLVFLREGWRRYLYTITKDTAVMVTERSPNYIYWVQVQAVTKQGAAKPAEPTMARTPSGAPSVVLNLRYRRTSAEELDVYWEQPKISGGNIKHYVVKYQCLRYLACNPNVTCALAAGNVMATTTQAHLTGLIPFAQYEIFVSGVAMELGPFARLLASTPHTVPETAPAPAKEPVVKKTNHSLTLTWLPAEDCRLLNGYPVGYQYTLLEVRGEERVIVASGNVTKPPVTFDNLLANQRYKLRVQQLVTGGYSNNKHVLMVGGKTRGVVSTQMLELRVKRVMPRMAEVRWRRPVDVPDTFIEHYIVTYQCKQLLACPATLNCDDHKMLFAATEMIVLKGLRPYALYEVEISVFTGEVGAITTMTLRTPPTEPEALPGKAKTPVVDRGVSWVTVQWLPPVNCTLLNGPLYGYIFRLLQLANGTTHIVVEGHTNDTRATFTHLPTRTDYLVQVFTVIGRNYLIGQQSLNINVRTLAPPPDRVEHLETWKRGYDMLGLRWTVPDTVEGPVDSAVIRYRSNSSEGAKDVGTRTLKLQPCPAWPQSYCYDLTGLRYNTSYVVTVRLLSNDSEVEGLPTQVTEVTIPGVPDPPAYVRVTKRLATSLTLACGHPTKTNGTLLGFKVVLKHLQSVQPWLCCQNPVMLNYTVDEEKPEYNVELIDLTVASSYVLHVSSVTAEYVSDSIMLKVATGPGHPKAADTKPTLVPDLVTNTTSAIRIHKAINVLPISSYFFIVNTPNVIPKNLENVIPKIVPELKKFVGPKSYVALELLALEVETQLTVHLGTGGVLYGVHGQYVNAPLLPGTTYSVDLLVLSEFEGERSYDLAQGPTFKTLD